MSTFNTFDLKVGDKVTFEGVVKLVGSEIVTCQLAGESSIRSFYRDRTYTGSVTRPLKPGDRFTWGDGELSFVFVLNEGDDYVYRLSSDRLDIIHKPINPRPPESHTVEG